MSLDEDSDDIIIAKTEKGQSYSLWKRQRMGLSQFGLSVAVEHERDSSSFPL